jgi:DNA-binding XRE family transcriptional regulator
MNKQQLKQARLTLNLSCDKFAQELGLTGKHRDRWIRRLESDDEKYQPSKKVIEKVDVLLKAHEIKQQMIKGL